LRLAPFGVRLRRPGDQDLGVRGHWFPRLTFLAGQTLISKIVMEAMVKRRKVEEEEEERERLFMAEQRRRLGLLPPKDVVSVSEEVKDEKTEKESEERRVEEEERKSEETERMRRKAEAKETRVNEIKEDCKRQRLESDEKKEGEEEERKSKELGEEERKNEGEKDEKEKEGEEKDKEEEKTEEEKERKSEEEKVEKKGGKEEEGGKTVGWIFSKDFFWDKRVCNLDEEFWKNEYWKMVRKVIQKSIPQGLLKEIYKQNLMSDELCVRSKSDCPNCCNFGKVIKEFSESNLPSFFFRWLFLHDSDPDIYKGG
jgi:hypothetical protein